MAINLGGLARGVSAGLRDYALIKGIKRDEEKDKRESTKFEWEKSDREKADKYQTEVADLTAKHPAMQSINQDKATPSPAAAGLAPMAAAQNSEAPPVNPAAVATQSVMPGQQQPSANPPMASAINAPAAGLKPPPELPKQMPGFNDLSDFAMRRAMIDVRYGKTDGAGLINLQNSIKALEQSHFNDALEQMDAGNIEQGFALLNQSTPKGQKPKELVGVKDGVYEVAGTKLPTKLITYRNSDGSLSTLNTAQSRVQRLSMDKIMTASLKGGEQSETKRHNIATEKSGMITAQAHKTAAEKKTDGGEKLKNMDDRVKKAENSIYKAFGINDLSRYDEAIKNQVIAATAKAGRMIRNGAVYEEAIKIAVDLVERNTKLKRRPDFEEAKPETAPGAMPGTPTSNSGAPVSGEPKKWGEFGLGGLR